MKKILLVCLSVIAIAKAHSQVLLNEVYTDPGAGKNEFFEFYSTSTSSLPQSLDSFTIVTYFETPQQKGFCVMDLPSISIAPRGYAVGSSDMPFDYQGILNSNSTNFSWNSAWFNANNGSLTKWVLKSNNLTDGNTSYDKEALPLNFNDFFFRRTGMGSSYTIFIYKNGQLINALIFGTGGYISVIPSIVNMPPLFVDMAGGAPDFVIDFSEYNTIPVESVGQDAGSDNGFIREKDGMCGSWDKSSAQVQHTPLMTNGAVGGSDGVIAVSSVINRGTVATGSDITYDVVSAPLSSFPIELQVYRDEGADYSIWDAGDTYVESNFENIISDGPFTTHFTPFDMNMLIVVKSNLGCIDKIMPVSNAGTLPVNLLSFEGTREQNNIRLGWTTSNNEVADRFEVEKSTDGKNFETAGVVMSSEIDGLANYEFRTEAQTGKSFYRLKMIATDKRTNYSNILVFQETATTGLKVIGNPVVSNLNLGFTLQNGQATYINVFDMNGRKILTREFDAAAGTHSLSLPLPGNMTPGAYIVELANGNNRNTARFVKQ